MGRNQCRLAAKERVPRLGAWPGCDLIGGQPIELITRNFRRSTRAVPDGPDRRRCQVIKEGVKVDRQLAVAINTALFPERYHGRVLRIRSLLNDVIFDHSPAAIWQVDAIASAAGL